MFSIFMTIFLGSWISLAMDLTPAEAQDLPRSSQQYLWLRGYHSFPTAFLSNDRCLPSFRNISTFFSSDHSSDLIYLSFVLCLPRSIPPPLHTTQFLEKKKRKIKRFDFSCFAASFSMTVCACFFYTHTHKLYILFLSGAHHVLGRGLLKRIRQVACGSIRTLIFRTLSKALLTASSNLR